MENSSPVSSPTREKSSVWDSLSHWSKTGMNSHISWKGGQWPFQVGSTRRNASFWFHRLSQCLQTPFSNCRHRLVTWTNYPLKAAVYSITWEALLFDSTFTTNGPSSFLHSMRRGITVPVPVSMLNDAQNPLETGPTVRSNLEIGLWPVLSVVVPVVIAQAAYNSIFVPISVFILEFLCLNNPSASAEVKLSPSHRPFIVIRISF